MARSFAVALLALISCAGAKTPSSAPLAATHVEITLDDGTKAEALDGRAFAVVTRADELSIYVFDGKAPDPTCTDVNVGGWMEKLGGGSAAVIRARPFRGGEGKALVSSVEHVRGGGGKKFALRSASAKGLSLDVTRYDQVFEGTIAGGKASGTVSGIVCAAK